MKNINVKKIFDSPYRGRHSGDILPILFIIVFFASCGNKNKTNPNLNKDILIDSQVVHKSLEVKQLKDSSIIVGYWFVPHSAKVNIHFYENGRFEFNDYNLSLDKYEHLVGSYKLVDSVLTLFYIDRPKQSFKFYKDDDDNYYIKKRGYYFAKGDSL